MTALTAETIVDLEQVGNIRVSPNGEVVAFVVTPASNKEEHPVSAIWTARVGQLSSARRLTAGTAQDCAPRWSSDGSALYFLSERAKRDVFQLYRISLDGGEAAALTDWQPGIAAVAPLPDAKTIALLAVDPDSEEEKKRKEARDDAEVYGERWQRQRLRLLDLPTREISTIDALGERHVVEVAPSPDGTRLAVLTWPTPEIDYLSRDAEIWLVDVRGRTATRVCHLPASGSDLCWGAGESLLFLAHRAPAFRGGLAVFAVPAGGGEPRRVSPDLAACPDGLATARDGTAYVLMTEGLDSWIGRLDPERESLERIVDLPGEAGPLSVSADGKTIAAVRSTRDDVSSVWAGPVGGQLQQLTAFNPTVSAISWGTQEPVAWTAPDGLRIDGLLILPPGANRADGPFPLMTLIHGGPYGRYADSLQLTWSRWGQWLATAGYAVLLPNPRGGSGRGNDFADRVAGAVGIEDWADVEAGIDHLIALCIADPERLAIGGWSQGGFMTAWAVGQTRCFKCGIMGAGVSDWGMMVATSDLPRFEAMLGGSAPWDGAGPHRHAALSPISFAGTVTTPVLVLHGADDKRVPVSQGRFFAQALREHDVPCELVVYPREPHGIGERNHQLDLLRRVRAWVERWLGPGWSR